MIIFQRLPKIEKWVGCLKNEVGKVDENTYFVGHSMGCQTIIRYLETLDENEKIGGAVFVAGWFNLTDATWDEEYTKEIADPWITTPIDFGKVKGRTKNFVAIQSDDDPYVDISDADIFKEKLNAKIIIEKNKGHFTEQDGVLELPIVLEELLKF